MLAAPFFALFPVSVIAASGSDEASRALRKVEAEVHSLFILTSVAFVQVM